MPALQPPRLLPSSAMESNVMKQRSGPSLLLSSRIPALPNEVLLMIIQHCAGVTLKNVCLASKCLARMGQPKLWYHVTLVSNTDCLSKFEMAMKSSPVAALVRHIVYDVTWRSLIGQLNLKLEQTSITPGTENSRLAAVPEDVTRGQIEPADDTAVEVSLLTRVMLCLPNVQKVTVQERTRNTSQSASHMPQYYQRICEMLGIPPTDPKLISLPDTFADVKPHARSVLLAAHAVGPRFKAMNLDGLSWYAFFKVSPNGNFGSTHEGALFKKVLGGLRRLEISFTGIPSSDANLQMRPFGELLRSAQNLETLILSFTDSVILRRYSADYRLTSYLAPLARESRLFRPLMPRLRDLTINACTCSQQDLIQFLTLHSSTLRSLQLSDVSLLRHEERDTRGCWVQTIKFLRANLRLQKVRFSKWLSNGGRQRWYVSEGPAESGRIRTAVEKYVTDKTWSHFPLERVAVNPDQEDVVKPLNGLEFEGDWTWTMIYGRKERFENTLSGSHFFNAEVSLESAPSECTDVGSTQSWDDVDWVWGSKVSKKVKSNTSTYSKCPKKTPGSSKTLSQILQDGVQVGKVVPSQAPQISTCSQPSNSVGVPKSSFLEPSTHQQAASFQKDFLKTPTETFSAAAASAVIHKNTFPGELISMTPLPNSSKLHSNGTAPFGPMSSFISTASLSDHSSPFLDSKVSTSSTNNFYSDNPATVPFQQSQIWNFSNTHNQSKSDTKPSVSSIGGPSTSHQTADAWNWSHSYTSPPSLHQANVQQPPSISVFSQSNHHTNSADYSDDNGSSNGNGNVITHSDIFGYPYTETHPHPHSHSQAYMSFGTHELTTEMAMDLATASVQPEPEHVEFGFGSL